MARYGDLDALEKKLFPIGMVDDGRYALPAKSVKVAIDNLPTADVAPKSEWISVDERLPDPGLPILIFTRKNRYYVGYYYKAVVDTTYTGFYADSVKRDVTHWMPMPEPPITDKPMNE